MSNVDGPRSDINDNISFTYDGFGNKATETQVVNNRIISTKYLNYNSFSQPERIVNPSGLVDQFIYNADGTLQAKITGNGGDTGSISGTTTSYTYDYLKRKKSETNPDNETILYDYDGLGRLIKTTAPDGSISTQTYFDNGEIQSIDGKSVEYYEINSVGRISKSRSGTNTSSLWKTYTYDGNGNITQTEDALGIVEKWTYDALNRNTSYTDGEGNISNKSYDKTNNLISSKDAVNSGSSPFNYINSTLVKDEINNDYAKKSYDYNQNDQVTNKYHGGRNCEFSGIDSLGREASVNCTSENSADLAYTYNYQYTYDNSRFGRIDRVSSNASFGIDTQYSYDNLDRIIGKIQTNKAITAWGGANSSLNVGYSYSAANKITSLTMPSGRVISYNYDGNKGHIASVNIAGNPFISNISYDSSGQLISWNIENTGAKYSIAYDTSKSGAIKSINFINRNNSILYSENYNFDADGRITSINKLNNNTHNYTYDKANRLISDKSGSYTYDKNGNRTASSSNTYIYAANTNQLTNVKSGNTVLKSASYLATGELRFAPFLSGYDGNGQMRYSGGSNGQYYMAYNHKNERTVRSINTAGNWYAGTVQYIYDESSNLIGEYAANGTPIVEYVWMGNTPIAAVYGSGSSSKIYAIVTDHNNTPRMLVDNSTNNAVWIWESTAFGVGQPTGSIKFNLRFLGQYYDEFTGLHYNLNRYYNPELGRYMEPDPIGLEGGSNPYAYAGSNPISNIDPSGLDALYGGWGAMGDWSSSMSSRFSYQTTFSSDYFYGIPPTVGQANANLSFNGGSGQNIWVNANRLMVTPNGNWNISSTTNQYRLPVEVTAYRNDFGEWIPSSKFTIPSSNDRGYWVFGELTMNKNGRLYNDSYNFEKHSYDFSSNGIASIGKTFLRNMETIIGGRVASKGRTNYIQDGYSFHFFNKPSCPLCKPAPK